MCDAWMRSIEYCTRRVKGLLTAWTVGLMKLALGPLGLHALTRRQGCAGLLQRAPAQCDKVGEERTVRVLGGRGRGRWTFHVDRAPNVRTGSFLQAHLAHSLLNCDVGARGCPPGAISDLFSVLVSCCAAACV